MQIRVWLASAFLFIVGCHSESHAPPGAAARAAADTTGTTTTGTAATAPSPSLVLAGQRDPGPRGGAAAAGAPYDGLTAAQATFFTRAKTVFAEVDSVFGNFTGDNGLDEGGAGLGPTFNGNSCAQCHAQPDVGGSSPGLQSPQRPMANPQVALATLDGATNSVPSFITSDGPVREARFISDGNGHPDGGVHALFTIAGRRDLTANGVSCGLAQPSFAAQLSAHNVIFRIPTPLFGLGLIENTSGLVLRNNLAANATAKANLGIGGRFNNSGNDGTITRFGWKAQNKSLLMFAGEAYNVEQGVSNELFTSERIIGCNFNSTPEDRTTMVNGDDGSGTGNASQMSSDLINFSIFMRLLKPPAPAPATTSTTNGSKLFSSLGCALCHTPSLSTLPSAVAGLSSVTYSPFSDFALHHMGSTLADGVTQGDAGPDEFRTAPLWGLGQRLFFLHDGRTADLLAAIEAHFSNGNDCVTDFVEKDFIVAGFSFSLTNDNSFCASEANGTVNNFNALSASQQQDVLNFLRSL